MSSTPSARVRCLRCSSRSHFAPSDSIVIDELSARPSRFRQAFQRLPKETLSSMAAKTIRASGWGKTRESHSPGEVLSPRWRFEKIPTFISRQSSTVLTQVTTNLPFENWTEVLGSERLTGAALDRLTHRCHILETKGESYRLQDAKRRRKPG